MLRPLLLLAALLSVASPASAVSVERVLSGLNQPMFVSAPAGDPRLFIVERGGRIRIFENGALRSTPFLDISGRVVAQGEGGLLGLAFAPDYATSRAFYVYYTTSGSPLTSRISRFRASATDPNVAAAEEKVVLSLAQPYDNHNGGTVAFGADGMLYMGFGDGGSGGDPQDYAQRKDALLGKMIRLDVSFSSFTDDYRIPSDNPFVGNTAYKPEIWALGLRNPYRFSFDRQTGALYIADVGQNDREEVDVESASDPGGRNYGWDVMEGTACYEAPGPGEPACNSSALTRPVYEYNHGTGCSITGGYAYRGSQASISGHYFFADYCSSRIYSFVWNGGGGISGSVTDRTAEFTPPSGQGSITNPVGFGENGVGELYIVDPGGEIFRVVPGTAPSCGNGQLDSGEQCDDGNQTSGDGCDANCRTTACGNGVVTSGEQCDDANPTNGDGCDNNCRRTACGNGVVTSGEQCDDGNATSGDGCDNNCRTTGCGNGVVTSGEQCDDGNQTSGDGCDVGCIVSACGNGIRAGSEQCDDGNQTSGDGCDANCKTTACGNGIRTGSEQCDDGNLASGDGCDANCTVTACGNGIRAGSEQCDDGNQTQGDGCDNNCRTTACGNGVRTGSEQCDDGNLASGDGCDANCRPTACGNAVVTSGEQCDDGNQTQGDGCDTNCKRTACGNGIVTSGEQCDDGNLASGDGCDGNCRPTACGNGIVTSGEQCDDGNQTPGDGCDPNCRATGCGNGSLTPPEQCDDGNQTSGDGCDSNCRPTACGNGVPTSGEQCDDGNATSGDGCDANCRPTGCGNGVVTPGEVCDDGNLVSGDGCDADCGARVCGDGVTAGSEQCDDGNRTSGDGCDANCTVSVCGNGIVAGGEACDDGNTASGDGCDANCTATGCGNGEIGPGELCDDGNAASGDGCDGNCTFTGCGNGVVTDGESCDDGNLDDLDGCSSSCQLEEPPQSRDQTRCILEVNGGVARVARAQSRNQEECLSAAAKGKLGSAPSAFDACIEADLQGRVAEAEQKLAQTEGEACSPAEPPELALGDDRLSGLGAASDLPAALVRDVFGAPASALSSHEARQAARCQREVLKGTNGLFETIWSEIRHAQTMKLEGRHTTPATNDADLSAFLEEELAASRRIMQTQEKLLRRAAQRCEGVDLAELFPGCSPSNFLVFAGCSIQTTRCRACELLAETNPRLVVDCDAFDDGGTNASCAPGQ